MLQFLPVVGQVSICQVLNLLHSFSQLQRCLYNQTTTIQYHLHPIVTAFKIIQRENVVSSYTDPELEKFEPLSERWF